MPIMSVAWKRGAPLIMSMKMTTAVHAGHGWLVCHYQMWHPHRQKQARKQLGIADKELVLTVVRENPESACPDNAKAVDAICNSIRQSRSDIRILDSHWQPLGFESNGHSGQPAGTEASESPTTSMHAKANALPGVQRDFAEVHSDRHVLRMQLKASDVVIARCNICDSICIIRQDISPRWVYI
jgi:hypothetical protein